ncbi:reverse transcriptase domain-containing protein [Tanacetum coccineum]
MVLQGAELNYPGLEKLILALVHDARRLRRYFQAHPIRVLTNKPIKKILTRRKKSGTIAKWVIDFGEHDIEFKGRNFIKRQILDDFISKTPSIEEMTQRPRSQQLQTKLPLRRPYGSYTLIEPQALMVLV